MFAAETTDMRPLNFFPASCLFLLFALLSCKKENVSAPVTPEPAHPQMQYWDLHNTEVVDMNRKYIDVDCDGVKDFFFEVLPVGDPHLRKSSYQFYAYSKTHTAFLIDGSEETPALQRGERVGDTLAGHTWWPVSAPVLASYVMPEGQAPYWAGSWKNASHRFLPYRIQRMGKIHYGWVELSLDNSRRKLILHRAAIAIEPLKAIKAGV
jgi:hypothetical protein